MLGTPLLDDRDGHDDEDKTQKQRGIGRLAHGEVEAPSRNQHDEHRLPCDFEGDGEQPPLLLRGQLVGTFEGQAATSLILAETSRRVPALIVLAASGARCLLVPLVRSVDAHDSSTLPSSSGSSPHQEEAHTSSFSAGERSDGARPLRARSIQRWLDLS